MDLIRPLALAGIQCAVVARPGEPPLFSRFVCGQIEWRDPWEEPDALLAALLRFAERQATPPVLFYQGDGDLLLVSRQRERLRDSFRFVVPDVDLVEDLVDKARFQALAERLDLPVPPARRLRPKPEQDAHALDLTFPLIVKPVLRRAERWAPVDPRAKAVRIESPAALADLWSRLSAAGVEALAQELVPGPETRVASYHTYVDPAGEIAGEFTGRKIRTHPHEYGHSTAVAVADLPDVAALGRDVVRRLGLRGVGKVDFKRAPDGRLRLLEVNPRFNLWHHPGALWGVNLPELVYADLVGYPRPRQRRSPGRQVEWAWLTKDARAARASGESLTRWLGFALGCDARSTMAWDDPMPFVLGSLLPALSRRRP